MNNGHTKGRTTFAIGEQNPNTKLRAVDVMLIRQNIGLKNRKELAAEFGVSYHNITSIVNRRSWKHIPKL